MSKNIMGRKIKQRLKEYGREAGRTGSKREQACVMVQKEDREGMVNSKTIH